jgi:hypothetical protein
MHHVSDVPKGPGMHHVCTTRYMQLFVLSVAESKYENNEMLDILFGTRTCASSLQSRQN